MKSSNLLVSFINWSSRKRLQGIECTCGFYF